MHKIKKYLEVRVFFCPLVDFLDGFVLRSFLFSFNCRFFIVDDILDLTVKSSFKINDTAIMRLLI